MELLLVFAFVSGLITILAPCIWPLLPVILSTTSTGGRLKPFGVTLGIMLSFTVFTLSISYLVRLLGFDPDILRLFAVVVIGFLGLTLAVPRLRHLLEGYLAGVTGLVGSRVGRNNNGFVGGFVTGAALGTVWSPCAGPILATIATLAATRSVNLQVVLVTVAYVVGIGIPLFAFATLGKLFLTRTRAISRHAPRIQQVFGIVMIITAIAIWTNYDKVVQARLLDAVPSYSNLLNRFEGNVQDQLNDLTGTGSSRFSAQRTKQNQPDPGPALVPAAQAADMDEPARTFDPAEVKLDDLGPAPDFIGITKWLNSEPLTLEKLRGKVVLIDFWTYSCINCIRTLPHVTGWWEKYRDKGLVIVGVHSPEFEFEKKTENVEMAMRQYKITYPVAQDNDFLTWRAYENHYWPAKYLIDAKGQVRKLHFGEGEYDEMEMAIQALLAEAGNQVDGTLLAAKDETPTERQTPETYLGSARMSLLESKDRVHGGRQLFRFPASLPDDRFALEGWWKIEPEYAEAEAGSDLHLSFNASKVFLVMSPPAAPIDLRVWLDGKVVDATNAGADVTEGLVRLDEERLYSLIDLKDQRGRHTLRLQYDGDGVKNYAFTFG